MLSSSASAAPRDTAPVQTIELLALASAVAFVLVGATVGAKLLWLARRTRALPETLVGAALFLLAAVAWPLLLIVSAPQPPPGLVLRIGWAGASLALALGWSGVFLFTWRVFRPGPGWGRWLAGLGISVELAAGLAGVVRAVGLVDPLELRVASASGLVLLLGAQAVYLWTALESFRYRALLRRRIPLGLADPLVADRFGLWGWSGVFGFGSIAPAVLAQLSGGDPNSLASHLVVAACGLLSSTALYVAFLPPEAYVRFVRAQSPRPAPDEAV
jgi:hypothetical protein